MMLKNAPVIAVMPVVDIQRAKAFYSQKLGLQLADLPVPKDSALFRAGGDTMLYLYKREVGSKAEHTVAMWMVDDAEKTVEELNKRGVTFERYDMPNLKTDERGIAEVDGAKSAWFKDTEGNIIAITEAGG